MSVPKPCPVCGVALEQGHKSGLETWQCPEAHGVGINLIEAYGHLQRDELEAIWGNAKDAPESPLVSPITGKRMVEVTFDVDDDMKFGTTDGEARSMTIEVDTENYFGWFSFEELRSMPIDDTRRGPSGPGLVGMQQMDTAKDEYDEFFDNLSPDDYGPEEDDDDQATGFNRFLGGLARRLR